jgi:hypothetical protein
VRPASALMQELKEFWDPNEWELFVLGLLRDRHGPLNINKVPARHKGDHGLDYYTLVDQAVYQCYAVQEPCDVAVRAEKQKAKMTIDLGKFCRNQAALLKLFGATKIRRWVLVVPLHDSATVNAHATTKTTEIRGMCLPYVESDFEVMIQDLECFDPSSRAYRTLQRSSLLIPSQAPSPQEVQAWSAQSNTLVETLTAKLRKRVAMPDDQAFEDSVSEAIGWFLEAGNALEALRVSAPDLHESLLEVVSRHRARLTLYGPPSEGAAHQILRQELEGLIAGLQARVPNLSLSSAEQIARGTLVDWLMRCPLDFPPYDHAS